MSAAFNGHELVGHPRGIESLVQLNPVVVGHDRVGIAVHRQNGRQVGADVG